MEEWSIGMGDSGDWELGMVTVIFGDERGGGGREKRWAREGRWV